jgi:hypothetical protein
MAKAKKLHVGQDLEAFPGGTFNELVTRIPVIDQLAAAHHSAAAAAIEARSPFLVRVKWTGEATLPMGNVVTLGTFLLGTAKRFEGLQHNAAEPTAEDAQAVVAVTLGPIKADGIGYAHLAGAVFARVNVTDEAHEFVDVVAGTVFESAEAGRFPIIAKAPGTGEVDAVVLLGSAGGGSKLELAEVTTEINPATGWLAAQRGDGEAQFKDKVTGVNVGSPVAVKNPLFDVFPVRCACWFDTSVTPPLVVSVGCTLAPE